MEKIEARKSVLAVVKCVDEDVCSELIEKGNIEDIKLSEYFDSLDIIVLNIEILARYPKAAYISKDSLSKDTTLGDLIDFFTEKL